MLQFLLGLSTMNVSWLFASFFGGLRLYNSPPLFFVCVVAIWWKRSLPWKLLKMLAFISILGTASGVIHGFDSWHLRQSVVFAVACTVWIYVYQSASERDIFNMNRTLWILLAYLLFLVAMTIENLVGIHTVAYGVSCVFAWECGATLSYVADWRATYFSTEASYAALAIVATIMPYLCANARVNRTYPAYLLLIIGCVLLYFAEGYTSRAFILFSLGFVVFPRLAVLAVPMLMLLIVIASAVLSYLLEDKAALIDLITTWFGGIDSRIDVGIETGSYTSRMMLWLIGARAFMESPIIGLGIGGTQAYFYELYDQGFQIVLGEEQQDMVAGDTPAYSSPMVVRLPAELGLVGAAYLGYYAYRAIRLALQPHPDPILRYAFLYSIGALLLSFCFDGNILNPCITGFIALLAQMVRTQKAETYIARETGIPLLPTAGTATALATRPG